jgi:hypothetical protein
MSRIAPSAAFASIPTEDLGQGDRITLGVGPKLAIHSRGLASPACRTT